jgi:hypothetical protein
MSTRLVGFIRRFIWVIIATATVIVNYSITCIGEELEPRERSALFLSDSLQPATARGNVSYPCYSNDLA